MFFFLQGLFVPLHVPILTVGVCLRVQRRGDRGGGGSPQEREREIQEP